MSNRIDGWEDGYSAEMFDSFEELSATFAEYAEGRDGIAHWHVPVWVDFEDEKLSIGVMGTRKGRTWQWVSPATEEQAASIRQRMLRVWAGRAEMGFERHYWTQDRLDMTKREWQETGIA